MEIYIVRGRRLPEAITVRFLPSFLPPFFLSPPPPQIKAFFGSSVTQSVSHCPFLLAAIRHVVDSLPPGTEDSLAKSLLLLLLPH
jgi:hypothetical protein